uniref:Alpha-L-glutamate ligase-related protein ATP-grasp domain-containing protein n=1 Tax=Lotharella globosa TaxID=91324 RepID=A0A6V3SZ72_9EUKA
MGGENQAPSGPTKKRLTAGYLYEINTHYPDREWFGLFDSLVRFGTCVGLYYYAVATHPISFCRHVYTWNATWFGTLYGLISLVSVLHYPLLVMVWAAWKRLKPFLIKNKEADWMMAGPGRVFFISPEGRIATLLWDSYLEISQMLGVFLMCRKSGQMDLAIEHSVYDRLTDKDFWRAVMYDSGMRIPKELARLDDGKLTVHADCQLEGNDIVAKVTDSYLGIGDKFLTHGVDFSTQESFMKIASEEKGWAGKNVLLIEWMRPLPSLGVHSLDIVTIATDNGPKVLSVLYWGECTGASSHTARGGYCIDVESETIIAPAKFYSPFFASQKGALTGTKLPGVKDAVRQALDGHAAAIKKQPWLRMIGWDCMFTKKPGEVVFFEGNFAASRIHRRITFSPKHAAKFVQEYSWPFA